MKCFFIYPELKSETQSPLLNAVVFSAPPLGMSYVAANLRDKRKDVDLEVFDEIAIRLTDDDVERICKTPGKIMIGMSCLTPTFSRALELIGKIKERRPDAVTVVGGVHASVATPEILATGLVDISVRNEGEIAILEIYDALMNDTSWDHIAGISFIRDNKIVNNVVRGNTDLDTLPAFPYDFFEKNLDKYSDFGFFMGSRGCPFECTFCSNVLVMSKKVRYFNVDYIMEHLDILINKYKQTSVFFGDDNIIIRKPRFHELADRMISEGYHKKASFIAQARGVDFTEPIIDKMVKANIKSLFCGFESGSDRMLESILKKETVKEIADGITMASKKGIFTSTTFIYGLPTETAEDRRITAKISREVPISSVRFNIGVPYPGTEFYKTAKREGGLNIAPEYKNFNVQYYLFGDDIPYVPQGTKKFHLIFDTMWANMRFYLRFKTIKDAILKSDIQGGSVLSLQNRRKKFSLYWSATKIAFLIAKRFIYVTIRMLLEKFTPAPEIKELAPEHECGIPRQSLDRPNLGAKPTLQVLRKEQTHIV